jgi:hypothetical protein
MRPAPVAPGPSPIAIVCTISPSPASSAAPFAVRRMRAEAVSQRRAIARSAPSSCAIGVAPETPRPRLGIEPLHRLYEGRERARVEARHLAYARGLQMALGQRLEGLGLEPRHHRRMADDAPPQQLQRRPPADPGRERRQAGALTPMLRIAVGPPQARCSGLERTERSRPSSRSTGSPGSGPPAARARTAANDSATPCGTGSPRRRAPRASPPARRGGPAARGRPRRGGRRRQRAPGRSDAASLQRSIAAFGAVGKRWRDTGRGPSGFASGAGVYRSKRCISCVGFS